MFTVNDDLSIYATRGDIVFFSVTAADNGGNYEFQPGDVVRIKVFGKKDAENVVLQKDFPVIAKTEAVEIYLTEQDTKIGEVISKPKDYWYEVELNPYDNPQTIIGYDEDGPKVFRLMPEGRDVPDFVPKPEDIPVVDAELDMVSTRPVQNQAVSRAFVSLRADYEETKDDITARAETMAKAVAQAESHVATERSRIDNLVSHNVTTLSKTLEYLDFITETTKAKIDGQVDSDGVFATLKVNLREANLVYGGSEMDVFIIPNECRPMELGLIHTEDGLEYIINYDTINRRYFLTLRAQDTVAPSGAGSVNITYALAFFEVEDARVGYDGKTYPTSGATVREQSKEIVNNLMAAGIYEENVLYGTDTKGAYVARNEGAITVVENVSRGYVTYDVREYAGKNLLISTIIDTDVFSTVIFADENNLPIESTPGYTVYYKMLRTVPENAAIMYVNYSIAEVANDNVSVKCIDILDIPRMFDSVHNDIEHTSEQLSLFVRDGKLPVPLDWELGWIDYSNGKESSDEYTNRMRTVGYYKPLFESIHYSIPSGYRFLALRYRFDGSEYTFVDSTGYINGSRSGEIAVNEGDCFRFLFRANPDKDLTDDYKTLSLYCAPKTEEGTSVIPVYWVETLAEKEMAIKDIVINATKADNDIAMFMAIADPHYPGNSGVSTALMKHLADKCGIGLTVCLGDLITDSTNSHEEGLQRIQEGMKHLANMSDRMILTQGNHDTNVQIADKNNQLLAERIIYDKEWILHTNNKLLNMNKVVFDDLRKAFYYDDDLLRIRFISLDSFEGKRYVVNDGVLTDLSLGSVTLRQAGWFWLEALASVPKGYGVVSFSHYGLYRPYVENNGTYVSLPMGGISNEQVANAVKLSIADGVEYIGHFAGHLHHDFVSKKDGLVSVHLLNDGMDFRKASYFGEGFEWVGDSPQKELGTTTECAFDVVVINRTTRHVDLIRIGAGEDRSFDY